MDSYSTFSVSQDPFTFDPLLDLSMVSSANPAEYNMVGVSLMPAYHDSVAMATPSPSYASFDPLPSNYQGSYFPSSEMIVTDPRCNGLLPPQPTCTMLLSSYPHQGPFTTLSHETENVCMDSQDKLSSDPMFATFVTNELYGTEHQGHGQPEKNNAINFMPSPALSYDMSPRCSTIALSTDLTLLGLDTHSKTDIEHEACAQSQDEHCSSNRCRKSLKSTRSKRQAKTGEFPCNFPGCGKVFPRSYNLRSHRVTHSGQRPFQCKYCSFAFARKHDLKRHSFIHEDKKPFECDYCHKTFGRRDALNTHTRAKNTAGLPACSGHE